MNYRIMFWSLTTIISLAAAGFAQSSQTLRFDISGETRSSVVYVPNDIDNPPVVFFIHGANGSGSNFERETGGNDVADEEKFIAVYPSASSNGGAGIWDDMRGTGNFPFFLAIIDTLDNRYEIDRDKIYMTGFSQGGFISFVAGCSYSDVFAAVASVSGHSVSSCDLERPVPVMMTFGSQEGADSFFGDRDIWLELNNCPDSPEITRPYPSSNPQSQVTRLTYGPCDEGSYVTVDSIANQGHQWPSSRNLNQAEEAWKFFEQFSLSTDTQTRYQNTAPTDSKPISAFFALGIIRLKGVGDQSWARVTDTKGQLVSTNVVSQGQFIFKDKPSGVYLVMVNNIAPSRALRVVVP